MFGRGSVSKNSPTLGDVAVLWNGRERRGKSVFDKDMQVSDETGLDEDFFFLFFMRYRAISFSEAVESFSFFLFCRLGTG